jgi:hypothetical protein
VDVILALTGSLNPKDYWFKMKIELNCRQLKSKASDGKMRVTDCANI